MKPSLRDALSCRVRGSQYRRHLFPVTISRSTMTPLVSIQTSLPPILFSIRLRSQATHVRGHTVGTSAVLSPQYFLVARCIQWGLWTIILGRQQRPQHDPLSRLVCPFEVHVPRGLLHLISDTKVELIISCTFCLLFYIRYDADTYCAASQHVLADDLEVVVGSSTSSSGVVVS